MPQSLTDRILAHMGNHDRQTVAQVAVALNEPPRRITQAMSDMAKKCRVYKVDKYSERQARSTVYSLTKPVRAVITPRYVPTFREMTQDDYDIWSHSRRAVAGR